MSDQAVDRTVLPIRRPPFAGATKRTLEGSVPDWNQASARHAARRARRTCCSC